VFNFGPEILVPLVIAIVGPILTYLVAARKVAGRVTSSEAKDLWAEGKAIRDMLNDRIEVLENRIEELGQRVEKLSAEILDLRGERAVLIAERDALMRRLEMLQSRVERGGPNGPS